MSTDAIPTIAEQLDALRTEILAESQETARKVAEEARLKANPDEKFQQEAERLLFKVYDALKNEIFSRCGTNARIHLFVCGHELRFQNEAAIQIITEKFRNSCGLKIAKCDEKPDYPDYVTIDLTGKAKLCTGLDENGAQISLDYPALINENNLRHECWKANYPQLAKQIVDEAKRCLDTIPNKHYGIPQTVQVRHHHVSRGEKVASTPFTGPLTIGNLEIQYGNLTTNQINDLNTEINKLVSHGDAAFEEQGYHCWMQITRQPEKSIEQPYFDYKDFYSKYDEVLPELQEVFDAVIDNLDFPSAASQIMNLTPQRKLVLHTDYCNKAKYEVLGYIKETVHWQHLIDEVNKKIAGIHTTEANLLRDERKIEEQFGRSRTEFINERVEFPVKIDKFANSVMITKQLQLEQLIVCLKTQYLKSIASKIIEKVIEDVNLQKKRYGEYRSYGYLGHGKEQFTIGMQDSTLLEQLKEINGHKVSGIKIDLKAIGDAEFMKNLGEEVVQQSGGMIYIEMQSLKYELILS